MILIDMQHNHNPGSTSLIVNDTPENLRRLASILRDAGYQVQLSEEGASVVSSVLNESPDVMLSRIGMHRDGPGEERTSDVSREIVKREHVEHALRKSAYLLSKAQEMAHIGSWEFELMTHTLIVSEEMYRIFGMEPVGTNVSYNIFLDRVHSDDQAAVVAAYQHTLQESVPYESIHRIIRQSDGAIRYVHDKCELARDANGRIVRIIGIIHDITERKQGERELERARLRYKLLTAAYRDGIAIINQEHQVVEANQRFADMLGYAPEEVLKLHTWDWEAVQTEADIRAMFADLTMTNSMFETRHRRKDGTCYDAEVCACGARVGEEALVFTISRDITARKQTEEELRVYREHLEELVTVRTTELIKANQILHKEIAERKLVEEELRQAKTLAEDAQRVAEAANRVKNEFLANMSHEVRTPLNVVLGFTEILSSSITDPQQKRYLSLIQTSGRNLLLLMNDILDLAKLESGKLTISSDPVNLSELVNELIQMFQMKIDEKGLAMQIEMPPPLPEAFLLDRIRLRQLLFNVLGNAVKFTHQGTIKLSVKIQDSEVSDSLRTPPGANPKTLVFVVEDTGIGIPADQQQLIFDAFRQQDGKMTRKYGGTGLGLAITKRLVDMMEGSIILSSVVGQGSCFTIILPRVPVVSTQESKQ